MLRYVKPTLTLNIEALDCNESCTSATAKPPKSETEVGVGIDIAFKDGGK